MLIYELIKSTYSKHEISSSLIWVLNTFQYQHVPVH